MTKQILIVDDVLAWREEMAEVLEASGYTVLMAGSRKEAYAVIDRMNRLLRVDMVILELELSITTGIDSGLEVLRYLRSSQPTLPCIVITGNKLPIGLAHSLFREYQVFAGLQKPEDFSRLADTVKQAFAAAEAWAGQPGQTGLHHERQSLSRQLEEYQDTLLRLQEQQAQYSLQVPVEILKGIDQAREHIERIEARLQEIQQELDD